MLPGPTLGSSPCLIAFSTSGCSSMGGTWVASSVGGQVQPEGQARPHAQRHDVQVGAQLGELPTQGHRLGLRRGQRTAQVDDQLVDHRLGPIDVLAHQRAQVGQRVEEHVRLELRPQQAQLGLDRQALRLGARGGFPGQLLARREVVQPQATHQQGEEDRDQADAQVPDHAQRLAQQQEGELVPHEEAGREWR